jgi:hypothetical protein
MLRNRDIPILSGGSREHRLQGPGRLGRLKLSRVAVNREWTGLLDPVGVDAETSDLNLEKEAVFIPATIQSLPCPWSMEAFGKAFEEET